ncbi:MAG: polyribonucleotide nucleotidyltransferase [Flavobacteriales endosymbiont of Rhyzopertha dominica]|nr:MAG: polyribonucleotide nucleotidyltransferase [Candidatus Shikimatogenerans bostrichidophilus]
MYKYKLIKQKMLLNNNRYITIETGQIANQSNSSIILKMENTILLSTVVFGKVNKENIDFVPLTIDYREKFFAGGKIPGGFIKREGKPSEQEILTMRLVDRLIRPLLPKNLINEIQIMITLLSYDSKVLPDGLVGLATSSALLISGIPYYGPVSQIKLARINKKFIVNPSIKEIKKSDINLIIGGSKNSIYMIDGEMKEISNKDFYKIIDFSHKIIIKQINFQNLFLKKINKYLIIKKIKLININNNKIKKKIKNFVYKRLYKISKKYKKKKDRNNRYLILYNKIYNKLININNDYLINKYFLYYKKKIIRQLIIKKKYRLDGRKYNNIRNIWGIINYLPNVHGSILFTRGETQCLTTVTLGTSLDVNKIYNIIIEDNEKFYLHYNFPPYSIGEIKKIVGISRREIGHGALAKKSLINIINDNIPYTIRIVSDILESNGSSSMATVCASSLALMDSGIKIKNLVAGISFGIIINKKKKIILYDILGEEDNYGDMDFKITRTKKGITSCQMDIKNINFSINNILYKILKKSEKCILIILNKMNKILSNSRQIIKSTAPKFTIIKIPKKYIGIIIGSGGKNIQEIQSNTNTNIIIKENKKEGIIEIFGKKKDNIEKVIKIIKNIIFIPKKGYIYNAKIKSIKWFGIFVEISKGIEGLLHTSELIIKNKKIKNLYKVGSYIKVKYLGKNKKTGKIQLSSKI